LRVLRYTLVLALFSQRVAAFAGVRVLVRAAELGKFCRESSAATARHYWENLAEECGGLAAVRTGISWKPGRQGDACHVVN
jgi:hypothetical protein